MMEVKLPPNLLKDHYDGFFTRSIPTAMVPIRDNKIKAVNPAV